MTEPKSITAPTPPDAIRLDEYWPYQVTVLADRISRRTAAIVKREAGLNLSQWRVLAAIAESPGRTAVDVVSMTPMDKGIVSRATKALLSGGYLVREASQVDGRVSHLFLTEAGAALYSGLKPAVEAVPREANAHLSPAEQALFCARLKQLADALPDSELQS
ncbi:MarR family winged helix-turn-helix transcriptional regulator [Maricaulis parjimensis]|uniref:MarR family winged helix-turn-helix transcriptional regulator n=1 Tax=Maricaulis parjimensis TaxID=144023 RepID=UPI001939847D|nr:MarR family winged helix-turn-helix transcriptional regulator [Maricaulis parjimensis]